MASGYRYVEAIEKRAVLLGVLIAIMVSLGGLAEITPLLARARAAEAPPGVGPYDALRLAGKDVYVREGCYLCHSQMIRTLRFETQRYGAYSVASESAYDRPFQWGSQAHRTGPGARWRKVLRCVAAPASAGSPRAGSAVEHAGIPLAGPCAHRCRRPAGAHARAAPPRRSLQRCRHRRGSRGGGRQDRTRCTGRLRAGPGRSQ